MEDIKNIIESLLFVAEEPLTIDRFKKIFAQAETVEIRKALEDLTADYEARHGGFYLNLVAGGYQIRTRPEYSPWIKRLIQPKPLRLSKAALETLAIIAYKQPIIRSDVEHVRGVDCGGVLKVLLERGFIRILGKKEIPGRPIIYGTTRRFLEVFDLKTLKDLPTPKEIEELGNSPLEAAVGITDNSSDNPDDGQNLSTTPDAAQGDDAKPEDVVDEDAKPEDPEDNDIKNA